MPDSATASGAAYPFERTVCACRRCSISCEHLPGALAPADVGRIASHLGYTDHAAFAREHLLASEGGTILTHDNRVVQLPTLVPATTDSGACRFLQAGRCEIHSVSPFGCAYVDAHMPQREFDGRVQALNEQLLSDYEQAGEYSRLCEMLRAEGHVAPPLETRKYRLAKAMRKEFKP